MELKFQRLTKHNLESVLEIEKLSFKNPWNKEMFEKEITLEISNFFVAEISEKIVGYGGFWKMGEEADIVNIAVHPDFRSKGLGKKILEFILESAKKDGIKKVFLEVRSQNTSAQSLYKSFGFKPVAVRPKYYSNDDAVIMEIKIGTVVLAQ
ncbi:MAG: ribosomal protein S18-alanine N-acetyltransferase [Elusimicrobia bacterium]|nr:ribosomal protein S18-alanine N-acetyltransferase [Elusimicrobiota bacterium]